MQTDDLIIYFFIVFVSTTSYSSFSSSFFFIFVPFLSKEGSILYLPIYPCCFLISLYCRIVIYIPFTLSSSRFFHLQVLSGGSVPLPTREGSFPFRVSNSCLHKEDLLIVFVGPRVYVSASAHKCRFGCALILTSNWYTHKLNSKGKGKMRKEGMINKIWPFALSRINITLILYCAYIQCYCSFFILFSTLTLFFSK